MQKVDSAPGDALIEIFTHLEILTKSYLTIWDTILPFRRRPCVLAATRNVARTTLRNLFCAGPASSKDTRSRVEAAVFKRIAAKTSAWSELGVRNKWFGYSRAKGLISVDKKEVYFIFLNKL